MELISAVIGPVSLVLVPIVALILVFYWRKPVDVSQKQLRLAEHADRHRMRLAHTGWRFTDEGVVTHLPAGWKFVGGHLYDNAGRHRGSIQTEGIELFPRFVITDERRGSQWRMTIQDRKSGKPRKVIDRESSTIARLLAEAWLGENYPGSSSDRFVDSWDKP